MSTFHIRRATQSDHDKIVEFNRAMAWETERIELAHSVLSAGVKTILKNPHLGFYIVAESHNQVVAGLMLTTEWSDWRNGVFWWVQSVYVAPTHRRQGVYRQMYEFVQKLAHSEGNVCGFRLYVERENRAAQQTYQALGMQQSHYLMFEDESRGICESRIDSPT